MIDPSGNLKTLWADRDHIDIRSFALSIAYHAFRNSKLSLADNGILFDKGNIAILPGEKLSWNALMFAVSGSQAEELAKNAAKPTVKMLEEIGFVQKWLKSLGATVVTPASELYIRHAGNIIGAVEPLTGAKMLMGGVPAGEALATFCYHFDVRGGILGIGEKALAQGFKSNRFSPPIFNIGIQHALMKDVPNLAVIGPGSGFEGYACAAGRIVEFNVAVGGGVGIAAIIALLSGKNLADISNQEVRQVLDATNQVPRIYGISNMAEATRLQQYESVVA